MPSDEQRTAAISLPKKLLFGGVVTLFFFAAVEMLLGLLGLPAESVQPDPFVGFSKASPLMSPHDDDSGQPVYRTNASKLVWFNDQSFPVNKSPQTFRIVCLGGSTTYGRPFSDASSYCGWLRGLLPMIDPKRNWEVINAGGISYASYRIASVMEEFVDRDVDLFILYCGHNEFLERRTYGNLVDDTNQLLRIKGLAYRSRLGRLMYQSIGQRETPSNESPQNILSSEVDEMLNHSIGPKDYTRDVEWSRGVQNHFRLNLDRMISLANSCGSKIAIASPLSNLRSCSPFKSEFEHGLDEQTLENDSSILEQARQDVREDRFQEAIDKLTSIGSAGRQHAESHYLLGTCQFELGQYDQAKQSFLSAIEYDVCPLRAVKGIKDAINQAIESDSVVGIDLESNLGIRIKDELGHDCFGMESFLDHVHPTIEVHGQIAVEMIRSLAASGILPRAANIDEIASVEKQINRGLDRRVQGQAFRNLAKVFHWAGKYDEAQSQARRALMLLPRDLESRYLVAECLAHAGKTSEAIAEYTKLFETGMFRRGLVPFGALLAEQGHTDAAMAYLLQAALDPQCEQRDDAYDLLGELHLLKGEYELAEQSFDEAERLDTE